MKYVQLPLENKTGIYDVCHWPTSDCWFLRMVYRRPLLFYQRQSVTEEENVDNIVVYLSKYVNLIQSLQNNNSLGKTIYKTENLKYKITMLPLI